MDLSSISAAIAAISGTTSLITNTVDARDKAKLTELKIAMNDQLLQLSTAALAINEKLSAAHKEKGELEDEIRKLREQIADQSHYKLHTFPTGVHVYRDARMEPNNGDVYFCAACMTESKKTVLQPKQNGFLYCAFGHPPIECESRRAKRSPTADYDPLDRSGWMGS